VNQILNEARKQNISNVINSSLLNEKVKDLLSNWANSEGFEVIANSRKNVKEYFTSLVRTLVELFTDTIESEKDFTWANYCLLMHHIEDKKNKNELNNPMFTSKILREMLSDFYHFMSKNASLKSVREYLNSNLHLFLDIEIQKNEIIALTLDDFTEKHIRTHFPLNSRPDQIVQVDYETRTEKKLKANLFTNTEHPFLHNLIKKFIFHLHGRYERRYINHLQYRIFFTSLAQSLEGKKIEDLSSFDFKVYKSQFSFYKGLREKYGYDSEACYFNILLVKFYQFIDDIYFEQNGKRLFMKPYFNRDVINHNTFFKYLEEGYQLLYRNPLEEVPESDKWVMLAKKNNKSSHVNSTTNMTMDFTEIENLEWRRDLKYYIWHSKNNDTTCKTEILYLSRFLNSAYQYQNARTNVVSIQKNSENEVFSSEFILYYRANLALSEKSKVTVHAVINIIRGYLKYYKNKYNVKELAIRQLKTKDRETNEGNPMTSSDFNQITNAFQQEIDTLNGELFYIIFRLSTQTKLRLGEIMNLERNCIISINEKKRYGVIRYLSKTSNGEYMEDNFHLEDIWHIQRAIELTQPIFEKASSDIRRYIFLTISGMYKEKVIRINHPYRKKFRQLVDRLYQQGKLENNYAPYDGRDTLIDNSWQSVEDGSLSSLEVGVVTGNSARTAALHYRKFQRVRYIEAVYKVQIGNVDVNGKVIKEEKEIENLPQVQQGAGACGSDECIKQDTEENSNIDIEDSDVKCLTCSKFCTTVERRTIFEERLAEYKQKRENAILPVEKSYYGGLADLYGAYLEKMYGLMEGE
jgi:integrase